jgi:hypothetical protein
MTDVTLSRDGTSVSFPLVEEGGEILAARTFGKPEVQVRASGGTLNPRVNDNFSGLESLEVVGKIFDVSVAHDLADLIKSSSVEPLTVAIDAPEFPDTLRVAPAAGQASALSLEFPAGRKGLVNVDLSLTRVGSIFGIGGQTASTPRASGDGPVVIRVGTESVELPTADLSLSRTVGRPNDAVRRVPSRGQKETRQPRYQVKNKVAADTFALAFETVENIPDTLNALTDAIFRQLLGRKGIGIDFNGLAGLGEIRAIPIGSSPFRQVRQAGRKTVTTPTLEFRRILDTTN